MAAMTATRVERATVRGLGMGVDRRASGGRASAVPRARRHAVIARVRGAGGTRSAVTRDRRALRAEDARGTARTRVLSRALGSSFDETDPETALKASSEGEKASENANEGSMTEVALWVGAATLFGLGVGATLGAEKAEEYFSGYLLEQSLSVDNLFVFVLVFDYSRCP